MDKRRKMEAATELTAHTPTVATPSAEETHLAEGTVLLGRYMLMRLIGQGGTSSVYRVRDLLAVLGGDDNESHIAAKIVKVPPVAGSNHEQQMMLREALTTRHLAHPNILKVYDYHQDGELYFVTMELIEGESLADLISRKPNRTLPYKQVKTIVSAVAQGLTEAHDKGVIHSDIKPSNILISESGEIKVIDFATARSYIDARVKGQKIDDGANYYGYTLAYASPQTIADEPASPSDDVFSLACIVYELISGKHPYARKPTSTIAKNYVPPRPKGLGIFQWLVLRKGLHLVASKRYSSVNTFVSRFFLAKNILAYSAISVGVIAALVLGVASLTAGLNKYLATQNVYQAAYMQQESQQQLLASLHANVPLSSKLLGQHLQGEASESRQFILASLKDELLASLTGEAQKVMGYSAANVQAEHFDSFLAYAAGYKALYPDSSRLQSLLADVERERSDYVLGLQLKYYNHWQSTNYSDEDSRYLLALNEKILTFDPVFEVVLGADVTASLSAAIDDAMLTNNIESLATLDHFIGVLGANLFEFLSVNQLEALKNASEVSTYSASVSGPGESVGSVFPESAVRYFIDEELSALEKSMAELWFDKDMTAASDELLALSAAFSIPDDSPVIADVRLKLIEKLEGKLKYHKRKGNSDSIGAIQALLARHQTVNTADAGL